MPKFIEAVVKATGRKQRIPAAWMDHPVLSEGFRETPRNARKATAPTPTAKSAAKKAAAAKRAAAKTAAAQPKATAGGNTNTPPSGD